VAFDEALAARVRERVSREPSWSERRMFGGAAFLVGGNLAVGVSRDDLLVRVGKDAHAEAMSRRGVRPFDMTGRPSPGWVVVSPDGYADASTFAAWVDQGIALARSLPPN
jgi:TfoX/Sxy family transcriptional regulator of competence genes